MPLDDILKAIGSLLTPVNIGVLVFLWGIIKFLWTLGVKQSEERIKTIEYRVETIQTSVEKTETKYELEFVRLEILFGVIHGVLSEYELLQLYDKYKSLGGNSYVKRVVENYIDKRTKEAEKE